MVDDLTGKRFGKLVAQYRVENDKYGNVVGVYIKK